MAEEKTIADRVRAVVATTMGKPIEQVTDGATFETLQADSLDIVETIINVDLELNVEVDDEQFTMASTVGDLIAQVEAKANGR